MCEYSNTREKAASGVAGEGIYDLIFKLRKKSIIFVYKYNIKNFSGNAGEHNINPLCCYIRTMPFFKVSLKETNTLSGFAEENFL